MKKTIVWTRDGCQHCERAKSMLDLKRIPYEERNISTNSWTREQLLEQIPNARTVPQIILYGEFIGGCGELEEYYESHGMWEN